MKRLFIGSGLVAFFALIVLVGFASQTGTVHADAAVVIKNDGSCGMPGSDANGNMIFGGIGQVTTNVGNDQWALLTCKGTNITNLSGTGQHYAGFGCGLEDPQTHTFHFTTDSQATVAPNGNATLQCKFDKTP